MHLKNFSLLSKPGIGYVLSPAYDLVATALVNPGDNEELALTLNGRKRKIKRTDFEEIFNRFQLTEKQLENIFLKMEKAAPQWMEFIDISFLDDTIKRTYKELISERISRIQN